MKIGDIGITAFVLGAVVIALMIWMGVSGHRWPQWLLDLTTLL
jgi:hypothetical protein